MFKINNLPFVTYSFPLKYKFLRKRKLKATIQVFHRSWLHYLICTRNVQLISIMDVYLVIHYVFSLIPWGTWTATFEYVLDKETTFNV